MPVSCAKRRRGANTAVAAPRPVAAIKWRRERLDRLTLFMDSPIGSVLVQQHRSQTNAYCARPISVRNQLRRLVSSIQFSIRPAVATSFPCHRSCAESGPYPSPFLSSLNALDLISVPQELVTTISDGFVGTPESPSSPH